MELEKEFTIVYTARHGRILRIREYVTKEEALQVVGLRSSRA